MTLNKRLMTAFVIRSMKNVFVFIDYVARLLGYGIIYLLIVMSLNGDLHFNYYNQDDRVVINFTAANTPESKESKEAKQTK